MHSSRQRRTESGNATVWCAHTVFLVALLLLSVVSIYRVDVSGCVPSTDIKIAPLAHEMKEKKEQESTDERPKLVFSLLSCGKMVNSFQCTRIHLDAERNEQNQRQQCISITDGHMKCLASIPTALSVWQSFTYSVRESLRTPQRAISKAQIIM